MHVREIPKCWLPQRIDRSRAFNEGGAIGHPCRLIETNALKWMQCVCQRGVAPAPDPGEASAIKKMKRIQCHCAASGLLPLRAAATADFGRFAASYEWLICCCASLSRRITSASVVWAKSA